MSGTESAHPQAAAAAAHTNATKRPHELAPTAPPVFATRESLAAYFEARTGCNSPYLVRTNVTNQRGFMRRVLEAALHPRCPDRLLLYANARQARALAMACVAASTVRALVDLYSANAAIFAAAGVDMRRVSELAAFHTRQAAREASRQGREPLTMVKADTALLNNITFHLNAAAENGRLSSHWAQHKAAEAAVAKFRAQVTASAAGAKLLNAPWVGEYVRAARKLAVDENTCFEAALRIEREEAAGLGTPGSGPHLPRSPRTLRSMLAIPSGHLPEYDPSVLAPAVAAAAPAADPDSVIDANSHQPAGIACVADEQAVRATEEERALAVQYANLVAMQRRTRGHWDAACPFRRVARAANDLKEAAYATFDADAKVTGEKQANAAKAAEGKHAGAAMEAAVWYAGVPHIRVALRAALNQEQRGMSSPNDDPGLAEYLATEFPVPLLDVANDAELAGARFVVVQSVGVKQNGRQVGELDGVVIDRMRGCVALVCEVKRTAADLGYARAQRSRFVEALALDAKGPDTEVKPLPPGARPPPAGKKRLPNDNILQLSVGGPQATAYAGMVKDGVMPPMAAALFAPFFAANPVGRWLLMTAGGSPPYELPLPSKVGWVMVKELGSMLALAGWAPPPVEAVDTGDAEAMATATATALALFDNRTAVPDAEVSHATASLAGAWKKAAGADPEHHQGLEKLLRDMTTLAVPPVSVGLSGGDGGGGAATMGLVCTNTAWVDVDVTAVALR